jgi:hypothetical protein
MGHWWTQRVERSHEKLCGNGIPRPRENYRVRLVNLPITTTSDECIFSVVAMAGRYVTLMYQLGVILKLECN